MKQNYNVTVTVGLCFLIAVLEGFDIQAMGVAAPRLAREFAFEPKQMGWIFSISNIGLVIGAMLGGWLADKSGRKPLFVASAAMFGAFTLLTAAVGSYDMLLLVRFGAGLGFGAALPNMMAIAAEISRPEKAALTAAIMFCGMPVGGGMSALATQLLPAGFDWRVLFLLGGILPVIMVPVLWRLMPETLVRREGVTTVRVPMLEALFGDGRAGATLLLWLTFLPTLVILYSILNWLPTLVIANGFDAATAPRTSMAFNFGSVAGALVFGRLSDRLFFRWPITIAYLALIASLVGLAEARDPAITVALSAAVGFFLLGANYALYGVAPIYYPTAVRGTGSGASVAVGRVGSILGPLLVGVLMNSGTSATGVVFYMVPVAAVAAIAVLALSFRRPWLDSPERG
ncbi:MAG TPA: 3-(3-hydroxy-phenyl)propionate transporter MhpT [Steroidobacteraceae bacterium]|jgi:AAHS family 3-hydroxyphenylpropionic acid transporter